MISEQFFKGYWHAAIATAVGVMVGYNALRWATTRSRRNAINLLIYAPLVAYEWTQAARHWRDAA